MELTEATPADFPEVVALANLAYRNVGQGTSWNTEAGIIVGERLNEAMLREDLARKPGSVLLLHREGAENALVGTAWLEPKTAGNWYLGLLTVDPALQSKRVGRMILAAAEEYAQKRGACSMRMTVLNVRHALLAWYERRGYALTGEADPFPYGDNRFGTPLRDDLEFLVLRKEL